MSRGLRRRAPRRADSGPRALPSPAVRRRGGQPEPGRWWTGAAAQPVHGAEPAEQRSLIAENNYGYQISAGDLSGGSTVAGLTRIDVVKKKPKKGRKGHKRKGRAKFRCRTAWTSHVRAPSVVPKLSLRNGLVYTYTRPPRSDGIDAWYLTTLDFRTGRTVYRRLAGTGFGFNNNYAPVTLGPDGTAYVGVLGGVVAFP